MGDVGLSAAAVRAVEGLVPRIWRRVWDDLGESVNATERERGRLVVVLVTVGGISVSVSEKTDGAFEVCEETERARERVVRPFGPHAGYVPLAPDIHHPALAAVACRLWLQLSLAVVREVGMDSLGCSSPH